MEYSAMEIVKAAKNSLVGTITLKERSKAKAQGLLNNDVANNPYLTELIRMEHTNLATVQENLASLEQNVGENINAPSHQRAQLLRNQNAMPAKEQELFDLQRAFELTSEGNALLMSRRVETEVIKASSQSYNEILEFASEGKQVAPTLMIFAIGFFLALGLPLLVIIVVQLFNNKIESEEDITSLTHLPVIGHIIQSDTGKQMVTMDHPRAPITEAFCALKTSFDYIVRGKEQQVILFTSSSSGEGKTFCAINLAGVLAMSGKKTILLGFDLRKPHLLEYTGLTCREGLSNYLIRQEPLDELIMPYRPNLDIILSGTTPPNPAELFAELFAELKKRYDYIVVDTSPVGLVTDPLLLAKHSDLNIYVIRPNYTIKPIFANTLAQMGKSNMSKVGLLVNGVDANKNRYGFGYGYFEKEV